MPFYITAERAVKLVDRFKSFEADRAIVRARMEQYRPRLPRVSEAPAAARANLRELFRENAPDLRHSVTVDPRRPRTLPDSAFVWELADAAIVLDRSPSTLSRALNELSCRRLWRARLEALRRTVRARRAVCYADGIFDLLIDFYALSYLERFTASRTGQPADEREKSEIRAFWDFMSRHAFMSEEEFLDLTVPGTRPASEEVPDAGIWADRPQKLRMLMRRWNGST
ncbi:MAG: hypothetical protein IJU32_03930 [Pyramidobacter sp.]|nr:hypothetical protein [Pyramidobacter sp.]